MAAPGHPLSVVAAVILDGAGRVLACRRGPGRDLAGKWEFPGGKVEAGESDAEALIREIREELGVDIAVDGPLTIDETPSGGRTIRLICLRARLLGAAPERSLDHDRLRWVSAADLGELDWAPADLPAVRMLAGGGGPPPAIRP